MYEESLAEWLAYSAPCIMEYGILPHDSIVRTAEDATQKSLADEQGYNNKVVAPDRVKPLEVAKAA